MSNPSEENAQFVTCRCRHCDGLIEFDATDFIQNEARAAECPHCHVETQIFVPPQEIAPMAVPPVLPPVAYSPVWFGSKDDIIKIRMTSGESHDVRAVHLYNESALQQLSIKRASATQQMGGVSTGLGAIGSASWVIGVSAILSVVESSLSKKAFASGFALIQEVFREEERLRDAGVVFPVGQIQFIRHPVPGLWRVQDNGDAFIHNGDDFLLIVNADGSTASIRWSAVERWSYEKKK